MNFVRDALSTARRLAVSVLFSSALTVGGAGCGADTDDDDDSGGGSGGQTITNCADCNSAWWTCFCTVGLVSMPTEGGLCSQSKPTLQCAAICSTIQADDSEPIAMECLAPPENCPGWSPGSFISSTGNNEVEVDEDFIADLVSDQQSLSRCDDGGIFPNGSVFEVQRISSGGFLYELGFRNGDVIDSVNGMPLSSYADTADAFASLYLGGETTYRFTVIRSGVPTILSIELV